MEEPVSRAEEPHWYAMNVFFNKTAAVIPLLAADEIGYFWPKSVAKNLLFIRSTASYVLDLRKRINCHNKLFLKPGSFDPQPIPDREMDLFIRVSSVDEMGMEIVEVDYAKLIQGQKVRVIGGPFEGAEGYIKRIHKDQRLVVCIEGVVAVATSYIPRALLEPVEK